MTTEVHEGANGNLKHTEVEPLGEIKEEVKKPADLCSAGDVNGQMEKGGCESLAEKDEPLTKNGASKQKRVVESGEDEEANEPQDGNDYPSEEEEGDGEGDVEAREGEHYEDDDEEYVEDGDEEYVEDEGDDDESEPPSKRRK